jgi:putative transposase
VEGERIQLEEKQVMPIKRYKPEQIVTMLRQIEVSVANGKTTPQACKEAEITTQTFYRWRKEYGGLKMDQAKRLKELEKENGKLKRLVAELALDKQILKDIAEGNFLALSDVGARWSTPARSTW